MCAMPSHCKQKPSSLWSCQAAAPLKLLLSSCSSPQAAPPLKTSCSSPCWQTVGHIASGACAKMATVGAGVFPTNAKQATYANLKACVWNMSMPEMLSYGHMHALPVTWWGGLQANGCSETVISYLMAGGGGQEQCGIPDKSLPQTGGTG